MSENERDYEMLHYLLYGAALALEGTMAYLAAPAAIDKFGVVSGIALTASISIVIAVSWYLAFNNRKKSTSVALGFVAISLLAISSFAIHTSSQIPALKKAQEDHKKKVEQAEVQYQKALISYQEKITLDNQIYKQQEQARFAALTQINRELKATKKAKQPNIYAQLVEQQSQLSVPTQRPALPEKPQKETIEEPKLENNEASLLGMIQSAIFGVLVPLLMWLGSLAHKQTIARKERAAVLRNDHVKKALVQSESKSDPIKKTKKSAQKKKTANDSTIDDLTAFASQKIELNKNGNVTVKAIEEALGISNRQARKLQKLAVDAGLLKQVGRNYIYPEATNDNISPFPQLKIVNSN